MKEEKILVTRSSMPTIDEYVEEIKDIWDTHWLTNMGPKHIKLQDELKKFLQVNYLDLFVNGHMALELILQAMNLQGEVITTPFTFASTTLAIIRNGLTPVFCDIDPVSFTIDVNKIEELITEKTCAILPVHVYGNICNIEKIEEIARKNNLKVIYDAAHTFGVTYKGRGIAQYGDASIFSFHATKVFNTIEGGAVCLNNNEYVDKLRCLKNFGIKTQEDVEYVGSNAKMNEFSAAMGLCNLRHFKEEIDKRKVIFERYSNYLSNIKGIRINIKQIDVKSNYAYYPIIVDEVQYGYSRDELYEILKSHNIMTRKYFYPLTNSFACLKNQFDVSKTPIALDISKKVLTLPLYADLDICDVDRICQIIKNKE